MSDINIKKISNHSDHRYNDNWIEWVEKLLDEKYNLGIATNRNEKNKQITEGLNYISKLLSIFDEEILKETLVFRGESKRYTMEKDGAKPCMASLFRTNPKESKNEDKHYDSSVDWIIKSITLAKDYSLIKHSIWEIFVKSRMEGNVSPFIDFTKSFLVALFFSCFKDQDETGYVYFTKTSFLEEFDISSNNKVYQVKRILVFPNKKEFIGKHLKTGNEVEKASFAQDSYLIIWKNDFDWQNDLGWIKIEFEWKEKILKGLEYLFNLTFPRLVTGFEAFKHQQKKLSLLNKTNRHIKEDKYGQKGTKIHHGPFHKSTYLYEILIGKRETIPKLINLNKLQNNYVNNNTNSVLFYNEMKPLKDRKIWMDNKSSILIYNEICNGIVEFISFKVFNKDQDNGKEILDENIERLPINGNSKRLLYALWEAMYILKNEVDWISKDAASLCLDVVNIIKELLEENNEEMTDSYGYNIGSILCYFIFTITKNKERYITYWLAHFWLITSFSTTTETFNHHSRYLGYLKDALLNSFEGALFSKEYLATEINKILNLLNKYEQSSKDDNWISLKQKCDPNFVKSV